MITLKRNVRWLIFASLSGNFTQRLDNLTEFERNNLTLIDLFFGQENVNMIEGNVHWSNVFHAKISCDRDWETSKD